MNAYVWYVRVIDVVANVFLNELAESEPESDLEVIGEDAGMVAHVRMVVQVAWAGMAAA